MGEQGMIKLGHKSKSVFQVHQDGEVYEVSQGEHGGAVRGLCEPAARQTGVG